MPNFDKTGPNSAGSQTGKKLGKCSFNNDENSLERRMRQHGRSCKNNSLHRNEVIDFVNTEIVGMKKCKRKHRHN